MAVSRPGASVSSARTAPLAADLACEPEAAFWAEACGWVPGTGHCRNRNCDMACLFAAERAAELGRVARRRRLRRMFSLRRAAP